MMLSLDVKIPAKSAISYPIYIENDLFIKIEQLISQYAKSRKIVIISDDVVSKLYGGELCTRLERSGYTVKLITFASGEQNKSAATKLALEEQMFQFGCDRHTLCLALGGGVVGDLAGFTAATYMRGINYIQIPTSLLAMVDSSVGGKTAVNTSYGKNIVGAFWQPQAVFMDIALLKSLPHEHVVNGFFEAVKIFLTLDKDFVETCHQQLTNILQLNEAILTPILHRAVQLKAHVVEIDEHERNLRMILNFGHTVGHALERLANYTLLHGYGVGYGMLAEAKIANLMGLLSSHDYNFIIALLSKLGINASYFADFATDAIVNAMRGDKKNTNQEIKLVLLTGIGMVKNIDNQVAFPVSEEVIITALNELKGI